MIYEIFRNTSFHVKQSYTQRYNYYLEFFTWNVREGSNITKIPM